MVLQYTRYLILGLTYLGLVMGNFPGLGMNRPTIALVGSAFLIALGVLDLRLGAFSFWFSSYFDYSLSRLFLDLD